MNAPFVMVYTCAKFNCGQLKIRELESKPTYFTVGWPQIHSFSDFKVTINKNININKCAKFN